MPVKIFAPAKVNLTLHVTGQRADGYHVLDSLVAFIDLGDQIVAEASQVSSLTLSGPFTEGVPTDGTNLVMKAAVLAGQPMALTLHKHLPPASGIGGGSADAAATLRAAARLGATPITAQQSLSLGADVPVCLRSKSARMAGIGDEIMPVAMPALHMVLLNPGVEVATPEVFKRLDRKDNVAMPDQLPTWPDTLAFVDWLGTQRNDLERAAVSLVPEIAAALTALALAPGALMVRMSGSGATCFALFENRRSAELAAAQLAEGNPWWWVKSASTLPG